MEIGYFTVDEQNRVRLLSYEVLKFARQDRENVAWHGEGRIDINDTIIYAGQRDFAEKIFGEGFLNEGKHDGEFVIYAFRYGSEEFLPFVKYPCAADFEGGVLAETIYAGEHIVVKETGSGEISVEINAQKISGAGRQSEGGLLLLLKRGKIAFFSHKGSRAEELRKVIEERRFSPFIASDALIDIEDFFGRSMAYEILGIKEKGEVIKTASCGRWAAICLVDESRMLPGRRVFSIGDEEGYLEHIKSNTRIYDDLYYSAEIKTGENELSCEARFRGRDPKIKEINKSLEKVCRKM